MADDQTQEQRSVLTHSPTLGKVAAALSKAQATMTNPERNRTVDVRTREGGSYSFAYATLDSILDMARPILAAHEIALIQGVATNGKGLTVSSMLAHSSGEWVESAVTFPTAARPQDTGSLITYGRRYTLTGLLGIAAEEDDDANVASGNAVADSSAKRALEAAPAIPKDIPAWQGKIVNLKHVIGTNKKTGKEWTKYTLSGADGETFQTFSQSVKDLIVKYGREGDYLITYTEGQYGKTIEEIKPLPADPNEPEIPF